MSVLARMSTPPATGDLAAVVAALLSTVHSKAPQSLLGADHPDALATLAPPLRDTATVQRLLSGPTGLGTSAARLAGNAVDQPRPVRIERPGVPAGLSPRAADNSVPPLYCPGPVRDDPALGEEVNDRLIEWAAGIGIYPGQLDHVRSANFGRLIMLAHPDTDDPDRLLAAAKCALAEWAVDDHYVDDESAGASPDQVGARLSLAYAAADPAHLTVGYAPELEQAMRDDPVLTAIRSAFTHLSHYATPTQVGRTRHEVAALWLACNAEASWRTTATMPAVWEYLAMRQRNSFMPSLAVIDVLSGVELPAAEYDQPRIRRAISMAASAATLVNDLYSMAREDSASGIDINLATVIAAEENCSLRDAIDRAVAVHDELVHSFEREATAIARTGSPMLLRFLAGVWAWLGGNREWHANSQRYATTSST